MSNDNDKASPRPWKLHKCGADCDFRINITPAGGHGTIANVIDFGCSEQVNQYVQPNQEQAANAALIVRAVNCHDDLIVACEAAQQCITDFLELYTKGCSMQLLDLAVRDLKVDALRLVKTALKKAGEL
jgi:hypothetical protein